MAQSIRTAVSTAGHGARRVAAAVVAGLWPGRDLADIEGRLSALPVGEQRLIVGGVLTVLFLLSLLAAQLGWIAMLAYFLTVIVIVN